MCPRTLKMKMNINPDSLLPHLPNPKDLKPFPVALSLSFDSFEGQLVESAMVQVCRVRIVASIVISVVFATMTRL